MSTIYGIDENSAVANVTLADRKSASGAVGEFKLFGMSGVPEHCLACDGSAISRTAYPELFAAFGTLYGAGDGSTTFNLPDFSSSGAFLRCTGGNAAALGTEQGDATDVNGLYPLVQRSNGGLNSDMPPVNGGDNLIFFNANGDTVQYTIVSGVGSENLSSLRSTDTETRPVNYAVNVCVVYE